MKPKHTPGPWAIGLETDDVDAQIINAKGQHVAKVSIDPLMPTASLIACAPELLSALTDLLDQLEAVGIYIPGQDSGQWHGAEGLSFKQAKAAINKATA